jgi:hypothetical protein
MDSTVDELLGKVEVVLERVLLVLGVGKVTGVALRRRASVGVGGSETRGTHDRSFDNTSSLLRGVDTETHVLDVVEGVEYTEDIETVLDSFGGELDGRWSAERRRGKQRRDSPRRWHCRGNWCTRQRWHLGRGPGRGCWGRELEGCGDAPKGPRTRIAWRRRTSLHPSTRERRRSGARDLSPLRC